MNTPELVQLLENPVLLKSFNALLNDHGDLLRDVFEHNLQEPDSPRRNLLGKTRMGQKGHLICLHAEELFP